MNPLAQALVEGILGENVPPKKKIVGMFAGGFKPPTLGHLEVVKLALKENPEMDELIIIVGSGTRDTITQADSLAIWNIYKKYLPSKVKVITSPDNKPPIGAIYSYARKNPDEIIYFFIGTREGNEGDLKDVAIRTKSLRKLVYQNVKFKEIITSDGVSGTKARQAILNNDKETFLQFIPNIPEVDEIWNMLTNVTRVNEAVAHEMSIEDFNDVGEALRNPKKAKTIYGLLLQMFPKQKEVIDYNYKNDAFAEMKRVIHGIDKYKLIGPVIVQPKEMKLAPEVEAEREKKFQQFAKGEIDKYFRDDKTDPRKVDVSKFPPITMDEEGFVSDGNHRAFIAKKQNKPLKAYKYVAAKNDHPNVAKILKLVGRPLEENIDQQDVEDLDNLADRELNPIDVVLTGKHFFDRLNDPRNTPEIDYLELEDFFTKLGDNREEFIDFLNKYKSVVATDTDTDINIPFMKMANKAIAKTIMRKRNFQTPNVKVELEEADPKKGTGKKPKGSGRRLYTDEDPKDTVGIKFSTRQDIVDTLNKTSFKNKSHARQSQVINLIHQRVRAAYGRAKKPEVKKRLKSALDYITKRKEASKAKTKRLQAQKKKKKANENVALNHNQKAAPFGSGYKKVQELVLEIVPKDVIDSFDIQDTLVPEVWDNEKLKPEVREKLLEIAQDFFESLDLPKEIQLKDIKLTGSLANYNWSKFSDFDLHLVLDFSEIDDDEEFVRNYFMAKKGIWNDAHDISIYNFPVEVYVENEGESHTASGLYSILNDKWIVTPKKKEVMIDKDDITTKAEDYISQFEDVQKLYNDGEYEKVIDKVDKIKERLRNMRSSGLEKGGEYSVENLAFKVLRRSDIIGQLNDLKSNSYDTMMSIKEGIGDNLATHIKSLTKYMGDNGLDLRPYPKVRFIDNDIKNAEDLLGLTAFYNPNEKLIVLYTLNRHPKDVLRSYAHELVHHHQNLSNTLDHSNTTNTNEDGDLEKIEREAYETGNILFRKWTDEKKNILQSN